MENLKGTIRERSGTRFTRRLRAEGMVPGIIYGHGEANVAFAASAHDLELLLQHGEHLVELDLDGQKGNYLIKAVQRDAWDHEVIHVDLARVHLDETVEVTVPVVLRGTPAGEVDGGVLTPGVKELTLECVVTRIPDEITVRVTELKVGQTLRVSDLPAIEGVTILTSPETVLAGCQMVAEEVEAPPAAEGEVPSEPEVIGKGEQAEEEPDEE